MCKGMLAVWGDSSKGAAMEMIDYLYILHNQLYVILVAFAIPFLIALAISALVLYFVVRRAVRVGVTRAYHEIHGEPSSPSSPQTPGQPSGGAASAHPPVTPTSASHFKSS